MMKNSTKLTVTGTLLLFSIAFTAIGGPANAFMNVNIALNGVAQISDTGVGRIRLSTQDIIGAIGRDTANNFPLGAKLLMKFPVGLEAGPSFVVRSIVNRTNVVDFDVPSSMLWFIQIGDSVSSSRTNLTGVVTANQTTIWELAFQSSTGSFDIQGYTTSLLDNRGNLGAKLPDTCPMTVSARVSGTGSDAYANSTVLQGTVLLSGRKIVDVH